MNSFSLHHWPLGQECSQLPFDRWEHQSPSLLHTLADFENCWPICSTQIWDLSFSQAKRRKIPKSEKMLCSPDLFRPACAARYINHICFSAEPSQAAVWSAHQPPSYQASCLCHHFPQSDINIYTNTQENWTSSQTRIFLFLKLFPSLLSSWQDASVRSLDILTFLSVNSANKPGVQAPSRTVWVLGTWTQEGIRGPGFSQKDLTVWICWLYFNSDTKMKIKIVWGVYFIAPGPCPLATKLPSGAVCTISPFQLVPFQENSGLSFQTPCGKDGGNKARLVRAAASGWGWVAGWCERLGGGPRSSKPVDLDVVKACGPEPGKLRYTDPVIDYSAASQKDLGWRGLTAIVSFGCLWGWKPRKCGAKMQPSGAGTEIGSPPAWKPHCSGMGGAFFLIQAEMGSSLRQNLIRGQRQGPGCMGGEEGKWVQAPWTHGISEGLMIFQFLVGWIIWMYQSPGCAKGCFFFFKVLILIHHVFVPQHADFHLF